MIFLKILSILALILSIVMIILYIFIGSLGRKSKWDIPILIFYIFLGLFSIMILIIT